jgi:hypothetical protein
MMFVLNRDYSPYISKSLGYLVFSIVLAGIIWFAGGSRYGVPRDHLILITLIGGEIPALISAHYFFKFIYRTELKIDARQGSYTLTTGFYLLPKVIEGSKQEDIVGVALDKDKAVKGEDYEISIRFEDEGYDFFVTGINLEYVAIDAKEELAAILQLRSV